MRLFLALAVLFLPFQTALARSEAEAEVDPDEIAIIDFGDNESEFASDGECDDLRFAGPGMTQTPLIIEDIGHDAVDCEAAYGESRIAIAPAFILLDGPQSIVWGDDESDWARDGECDDLRFRGEGMTEATMLADAIAHDATDCRVAFEQGRIAWAGIAIPAGPEEPADVDRIAWGDDDGDGAFDGTCDDMRFTGEAIADDLDADDVKHDATDCRAAFVEGRITLRE